MLDFTSTSQRKYHEADDRLPEIREREESVLDITGFTGFIDAISSPKLSSRKKGGEARNGKSKGEKPQEAIEDAQLPCDKMQVRALNI